MRTRPDGMRLVTTVTKDRRRLRRDPAGRHADRTRTEGDDVTDEGTRNTGGGPRGRSVWDRLTGDLDHIGWSVLPLFVAVGLAGAVMAGALTVVYYSQQVSDLEAQTRDARGELDQAVVDVEDAASDALEAIGSEVEAVQDALARTVPVEDIAALGLVVVEAQVNAPPPPSATVTPTPAETEPAPAGTDAPQPAAEGDPTPSEAESPSTEPTPSPTPTAAPVRPRLGVAFAVAISGGDAFLATSYDLVVDPDARAGVVEQVVIRTINGTETLGTVHSWDEVRGVALLRAPIGALPIGPWRPAAEPLDVGDRLTAIGLTPQLEEVQVDGTVGQADAEAIVASLPDIDFLRGAPIVDREGRIVAIYTPGYRPFGAAGGDRQAIAPVSLLCERMLDAVSYTHLTLPTKRIV